MGNCKTKITWQVEDRKILGIHALQAQLVGIDLDAVQSGEEFLPQETSSPAVRAVLNA